MNAKSQHRSLFSFFGVFFLIVLLLSAVFCSSLSTEIAFARSDDSYGFSDVSSDDWYATDDILGYVTDNGLLTGYSDGSFGPWDNISRGQVATILWRMAGQPEATSQKFSDVNYSLYYGDAISWARSVGVISGYKDANGNATGFGPDDPVTREQFAVMLANYANYAGISTSSDLSKLNSMPDANSVSSWAKDSVGWVMDCEIITGDKTYNPARIVPQGNTQRAAAAKMIAVFHRDVLGVSNGITYKEEVIELSSSSVKSADDTEVVISSDAASNLSVGDIVVTKPTEDNPLGSSLKISKITNNGNNATLTGTKPSADELFEDIDIAESIPLSSMTFIPDNGTSLDTLSTESIGLLSDPAKITINLGSISIGENAKLSGSVDISSSLNIVVKKTDGKINASADWSGTNKVNITLTGSLVSSEDQKVKIGRFVLVGEGITGTGAYVDVYITFDINGNITLSGSTEFSLWADYVGREGKHFGYESNVTGSDVSFKASGKLGLGVALEVGFAGLSFMDLALEGGGKATAEVESHPSLICADINAYLYLQAKASLLEGIPNMEGMEWTEDIFDKDVTPLSKYAHVENGIEVPDCTWDDGSGGESGSGSGSGSVSGDSEKSAVYGTEFPGWALVTEGDLEGWMDIAEPFWLKEGTSLKITFHVIEGDLEGWPLDTVQPYIWLEVGEDSVLKITDCFSDESYSYYFNDTPLTDIGSSSQLSIILEAKYGDTLVASLSCPYPSEMDGITLTFGTCETYSSFPTDLSFEFKN